MKRQTGFTLIELIVVIVILGILGAIALPRYINVAAQAHRANVTATSSGIQAAVALVRAQYFANGLNGAQDNIVGFGDGTIDVNATGYPTDTAGANTIGGVAAQCVSVWNGILQGGAPTVATAAGSDYLATAAGEVCTFAYQRDLPTVRTFNYDAATGTVAVVANP